MTENGEATVIGADSHFRGELNFNAAAKINGRFEGQISGKGELQVACGAQCKADVAVGSALIDGMIQGNLKALEVVQLNADGVVRGNITAAKMVMTEGAAFYGKCAIGPDGAVNKPSTAASGKPAVASTRPAVTSTKPTPTVTTAPPSTAAVAGKK